MNQNFLQKNLELKAEKRVNGLYYGLLAGLGFALVTWGYDGLMLARSHVALPWLKFLLGGGVAMLVFGIAGWLTALFDSFLVSFVSWLLGGILLAWVTAHLPHEGLSTFISLLQPRLHQLIHYPFTEGSSARLIILLFIICVAAILAGLLELSLVDSATSATAPLARFLPLSVCLPIFFVAGYFTDNLMNEAFRSPMLVMDHLINFGLETQGTAVDKQLAREMHLGALNPVQDRLDPTRRMFVYDYDNEVVVVNILVDFNNRYALCTVVNNQPSFCKPVELGELAGQDGPPSDSSGEDFDQRSVESTPALTPTAAATQTQAQVSRAAASRSEPVLSSASMDAPILASAPRYTISLDVNYDELSFVGKERVDYTNTEKASLDRLNFRLIPNGKGTYGNGSLAVAQVLVDGKPARTQLFLNDTVLEVQLDSPLAPGEGALLDLDFKGVVPVDFGGSAGSSGYGIYNYSEGVLALSAWYPILAVYEQDGWNLEPVSSIGDSVYSDTAFYQVDLTVSSDLVVAATGVSVDQQESGSQTHYRFSSGPARDFFLIMSPDFQVASQVVDGTRINSYSLPDHAQAGKQALSIAADSLHIYNQKFGPYPYAELDVVGAPLNNAAGVEFPGIVLIGDSLYDEPSNPAFTVTTAHEVGHQWWYNIVGNNVFAEPWLDEALTTYSASLYNEFVEGEASARGLFSYYQNRYDQLVNQGKDDKIAQSLAYFEGLQDPGVYSRVVYTKGALFFRALRQEIGDQAFFKALQDYYQTYQYQIATGTDLLNEFEQAAGRPLDEFFREWLYSAKAKS